MNQMTIQHVYKFNQRSNMNEFENRDGILTFIPKQITIIKHYRKGWIFSFNLSLVTLLCICVYSFVSFILLIISSSLYKNSCFYLYIIDLNLSINSEFLFKALGGKKIMREKISQIVILCFLLKFYYQT